MSGQDRITLSLRASTREAVAPTQGGRTNPFLLMPITLFFLLLGFAVLRAPNLMTSAGIGSAIIVATPLILATYALMAVVIAGRGTVDLSVGPLIGFINVTMIQLHVAGDLDNIFAVIGYALFVGALYQFIFALIVIYVRVQPIIVSLSGYLALSGINLVILPRPGGVAPTWMATWGLGTTIFSPVLLIFALATLAWILFTQTAFYTHLRLMGSDERAVYASGVPIFAVRIGAHLISGGFAGLASICFTALISSGDPSQGTTYTLIAVTALVLGGASLAGGRGGVFGSFLGAVNLYLITFGLATFSFGAVCGMVFGHLWSLAWPGTPGATDALIGAGAVAGGALLAACSSGSSSATATTAAGASTTGKLTGDLAVAALAASLENLAVAAYGDVLAAAAANKLGTVPPAVGNFVTTVKAQHTQHAQAWNSAIVASGHKAITGPDQALVPTVNQTFAQVTDVTGAAKLALTLENVAAQTYQTAIAAVKATSSIKVAASIQPVEMQHAAILYFVLGQYPVPNAFNPVSDARPLTDYTG